MPEEHISRKAAARILGDTFGVDVVRKLHEVPAADVAPVVRCEKCAHARPTVRCSDGKQLGIWCSYHDIVPVAADDFCSYGRKQNEGEVEHDS